MFCTECGQKNSDASTFCMNCGNPLKSSVRSQQQTIPSPVVPMQSQYTTPMQNTYSTSPSAAVIAGNSGNFGNSGSSGNSGNSLKTPKKSHKGLIIGLICGAVVLLAAAVLFVLLRLVPLFTASTGDSGTSIAGLWSCEENADVLKFKENGSVYVYSADDTQKGTYEYTKNKAEGVITLDDTDYDFTVDKDEINVEDMGVYTKEDAEDFDIDTFIEDNTTATEATKTTSETTEASIDATEASAVESVTDKAMTLTFDFGDRTGTYTGDLLNGLPDGYGSFTSSDADGEEWIYEGNWADGHLDGQGTTTWATGYMETGEYKNDYLNGEGQKSSDGIIFFEGMMADGIPNGIGTIYNSHGETVYTGNFTYGFIQESAEDRSARVGAFKDQSIVPTYEELYQACLDQISIRSQITGTVFQVYVYDDDEQYYCDFLMYEQGIEEAGSVIEVYYRLSEGEAMITEGQSVTVWGTSEYLYTYQTSGGDTLTVPHMEAFSVE